MKRYYIYQLIGLLIILLAFASSCEVAPQQLEGNGNVTVERKAVQEFSGINIDGVLTVYLTQGDLNRVEVHTDENLHDLVDVKTINGVLYIDTDDEEQYKASQMDVYITAKNIDHIKLNGVTALYSENTLTLTQLNVEKYNTGHLSLAIHADDFSIISDGTGDVELTGKAGYADIDNSMVGTISAFGFMVKDMRLIHDGTGNIEVYVAESLEVDITGVGDVYCKGQPSEITKISTSVVGRLYVVD
ncbi:MAG: DUF2807 domain-containing protein [Bacteroidales bacterium]|nr:DUF2807 domain-containing protein [Bacteroidales bacterium]MBN2818288.1 DUF2807 domain-containing protein [Bacteroidales bacterium]